MLITRSILVLCAVAALLALPAGAGAQSTTLNGTATLYQIQGTAPTGAMLTVVLREFKSGAATSIATQTFPVAGKPAPFSFAMTYDPARIDPNLDYTAEATYALNGQVRFKTSTPYAVLTKGNPTTVNMVLYSVQLPNTSSGAPLLALAGLALALALGVRLLRVRAAARVPVRQG